MNVDPNKMADAAEKASDLLKSLANPHRLMILCQLIEGEHSVGQITEFLGIRDSTVSQHLALLRKDGLVTTRRDGQVIWYSVASVPAKQVLETLFKIFCAPDPLCGQPSTQTSPRKRKATA